MASQQSLWRMGSPLIAALSLGHGPRSFCDDRDTHVRATGRWHAEKAELVRKINMGSQRQLIEWAYQPDAWWDGKSMQRKSGLEVEVYFKRVHGAPTIYCGKVEVDATQKELELSTLSGPTARKQNFDPAVKEFAYLEDYADGYALQRTVLNPQLGGIISGRFSDDFVGPYMKFSENPEVFAHSGAGRAGRIAQSFLQAGDLEFSHQPTALTECLNQASGIVMMRVCENRWRVWYFIQSHAGGNLPRWAVELAMPSTVAGMLALVQKDVFEQRREQTTNPSACG